MLKKQLADELQNFEEMEENGMLSRQQLCRKAQVHHDLMEIYEKEEQFWQQRSSENWLLHGDNNTEYFH